METQPIRGLFLHHSVGRYLLRDGELRRRLAERDGEVALELWDHDYNEIGLSDGSGRPLGEAFPLPGDNTDPLGFLRLFGGQDEDAVGARKRALEFELIVMKSCYPNSAIRSHADLESAKNVYWRLLRALSEQRGTRFLMLTSPPLVPLRTDGRQARRARRLATWLASEVQLPSNVQVFDLFDRLAEPQGEGTSGNRLRRSYRRLLPVDAHPNVRAGEAVAPELVEVLSAAARWAVGVREHAH